MNELIDLYKTLLEYFIDPCEKFIQNLKTSFTSTKKRKTENIFSFPDYALSQRLTKFFKELKLKYIIHLYRICYKIYQKKRRENN
ncbi:hypothetical protein M0811_01172 [Anaeramoeba ignava]|uniref:Uncharacterized protein n=1 Tax=Anaeramoeba ignava TaxID=1746090 RepID=A0A9Q0LJG6_ANAIG|nr:hypothetical protein M0811_01172 [Anaeramoeba ignava]